MYNRMIGQAVQGLYVIRFTQYIISPACPGSAPGSSPRWVCPKHLPRETSWRHPNQIPNHLNWLLSTWRSSSSTLSLSLISETPHPISKAEPSHPAKEAHFCCSYAWSFSFGHYPDLMAIGEGWDVDWPVNRELCLLAQLSLVHNRLPQRPRHCWRCPNPSVNLPFNFSLTREQNPEILELLHLEKQLSPNL